MKRIERGIYSSARIGSSILINLLSVLTFYIYDSYFHVNPLINGFANGFGKLIIALSSVVAGYLSDHFIFRKFGRRKPFIVIGAPALALSFILLFTPFLWISIDATWVVSLWLIVFTSAVNFFYGFLTTPYQAWMPEITTENERIEVSSLQNIANLIGVSIGFGFSFILAALLKELGMGPIGIFILTISVLIFSFLEVLGYLPSVLLIPEGTYHITQPTLIEEIRIVSKNKTYTNWLGIQGLFWMAITILMTLVLTFIDEILNLQGIEFLIFGSLMFGSVVIFFPIWGKVAEKYTKRVCLLVVAVTLILTLPFTVILQNPQYAQYGKFFGYLGALIIGASLSGYFLFPYIIIADIAHEDEILTGVSRAGIYTGFSGVILNLFQAVGLILVGILRGLPGGIYYMGPIAAVIIFLAIPLINATDLDPLKKYAPEERLLRRKSPTISVKTLPQN